MLKILIISKITTLTTRWFNLFLNEIFLSLEKYLKQFGRKIKNLEKHFDAPVMVLTLSLNRL